MEKKENNFENLCEEAKLSHIGELGERHLEKKRGDRKRKVKAPKRVYVSLVHVIHHIFSYNIEIKKIYFCAMVVYRPR